MAEAVAQKLAWAREGAGARFDAIEPSPVPINRGSRDQRRERNEQLIRERGWAGISVEQVWEMPSTFIGSIDQIVEDMQARREQYGFSNYVISDTQLELCATARRHKPSRYIVQRSQSDENQCHSDRREELSACSSATQRVGEMLHFVQHDNARRCQPSALEHGF